jgi:hypothetical protein
MLGREFTVTEDAALGFRDGVGLALLEDDGDLDQLMGIGGSGHVGAGEGRALAACQGDFI